MTFNALRCARALAHREADSEDTCSRIARQGAPYQSLIDTAFDQAGFKASDMHCVKLGDEDVCQWVDGCI